MYAFYVEYKLGVNFIILHRDIQFYQCHLLKFSHGIFWAQMSKVTERKVMA